MAKDYYKVLGVDRNASSKEIKQAFRRLAKQYHPDTNPDNPEAETKFKEVNEAYEILNDEEKRKMYDQFGADYSRFQGFQGANTQGYGPGGFRDTGGSRFYTNVDVDDSAFGDLFEQIFGGFGRGSRTRTQQQTPQVGRDMEHSITISLREAYEGTTRQIRKGNRRINVSIPAGASTGTKVRLVGEGEPSMFGGGKAGDLYLVVQVENDSQFKRDGNDLHVEVNVDVFTAMLGGEVEVPTMTRPVRLKIPAGSQSKQRFRITGKGMPVLRNKGEYGDLYAHIVVMVPERLTEEQQRLVMQLKQTFDK